MIDPELKNDLITYKAQYWLYIMVAHDVYDDQETYYVYDNDKLVSKEPTESMAFVKLGELLESHSSSNQDESWQ